MRTLNFGPINDKCSQMLHGADYYPEQWAATPGVWDEDMRLMRLAGCNVVSVGVFAWATLEPAEGRFEFGWLDAILDKLAANNAYAALATPSGAKPAWMSRKYPEIRKVNADGVREPHCNRHNHCRTSPVYREKCRIINTKLAERYKDHPALLVWHISNEYNGKDCFCGLCVAAFRDWLRARYDNDIAKLNHAYWSAFWANTLPDFDHVEPANTTLSGMMLDWERFKTQQTIDFFLSETAPCREITPDIPITTNFMMGSPTLDYNAFAKVVDFVSWDSYPRWHEFADELGQAVETARHHDQCRAAKGGKPFMLMESVPSRSSGAEHRKRKEPGMNVLSSLQAVAHGSDTVQYFQWRKSRNCGEQFHGAVVDHEGSANTREFREVADVGRILAKLDGVAGTSVASDVALIQDWENEWALGMAGKKYLGGICNYRPELNAHYRPFWDRGISVDVIDQTLSLDDYKLVVAPMVYMLRPGFAGRLKAFVENGGTAVMTYCSAIVDETNLCFLGGMPGDGLREVFGVWEEETQGYFPGESVGIQASAGNALGLDGSYKAVDTCSVIHAESAEVLATFTGDYFAGSPAATMKRHGKGRAIYLAARTRDGFLADLYGKLAEQLGISSVLRGTLPNGVTAQMRTDGVAKHVFLMNFNRAAVSVPVTGNYCDLLDGKPVGAAIVLQKYGVKVLKEIN